MSEENEMSEEELEDGLEEEAPKKSPIKTLLLGIGGAILLGGVAAGVAYVAPTGGSAQCKTDEAAVAEAKSLTKTYSEIVFVNLDPLVITLGPNATSEYLKISVSLETTSDNAKAAEHLKPRFRDVLNMYLRAVDEKDLTEPAAMMRLRAQILRRLQVVANAEIVHDVLITEFVLN